MPVDAPQYPVNLILSGRPVLVVGGGAVAARKVAGLVACGAAVRVVATAVSDEVKALAATAPAGPGSVPGRGDRVGAAERDGRGSVAWEERPYRRGEVAGYRLAVAATDDPAVNRTVYDDGEAAGVWVNAADEPSSCSFTLPSVARRGPLVVAVSTGGHSPALAAWLRSRLEANLGPEYEVLLGLLSAEREARRAAGRSTEGLNWLSALDSDMLELVRSGRLNQARERLQACLSSS